MGKTLGRIWYGIVLVLHRHYPPRLWIFYPLYRFLRRRLRVPMVASNLAVWIASAALHGGLLAATGSAEAGCVFFVVFVFLGLLSSGAVLATKPNARIARRRCGRPAAGPIKQEVT